MGQVFVPAIKDIILTDVDRLVARNADGGLSAAASHIVLLGEAAGQNLGAMTDIYVIGEHSLAGGFSNAVQNGTVVYGANIFNALTGAGNQAQLDGPNIAIGNNIAPLAQQHISTAILIGGEIANDAPALPSNLDASIVIGYQAIERQRTLAANGGVYARRSVLLGFRVLRGTAFSQDGAGTGINESIFIGSEAGENAGLDSPAPGLSVEGTIAIGTRALRLINTVGFEVTSNNIAIGQDCGTTVRSGQRNVWIGASLVGGSFSSADNVMIGAAIQGAVVTNGAQNVVLGANASVNGLNSRNIFLGSGANALSTLATASDSLLVETVNSTTNVRRNLVYGNMGTLTGANVTACGILFGLSDGTNRDLPGMNIVKIVNGGRDAGLTAPVGGGYFYVNAGALHWVGSANTDTVIAPA